jgi:hypothetical protein
METAFLANLGFRWVGMAGYPKQGTSFAWSWRFPGPDAMELGLRDGCDYQRN